MCLTNSLESVAKFEIEKTPLGVSSQSCHKPLILSIFLSTPHAKTNSKIMHKEKIAFRSTSLKNRIQFAKFISSRISSLYSEGISPDYKLLKKVFLTAYKFQLRGRSGKKPKKTPATTLLQRQFRYAMNNMMREKSNFSVFVADHLEKLLYAQHKAEKASNFNKWLARMNDLDFKKWTRTFFKELRRKFRVPELAGPIKIVLELYPGT